MTQSGVNHSESGPVVRGSCKLIIFTCKPSLNVWRRDDLRVRDDVVSSSSTTKNNPATSAAPSSCSGHFPESRMRTFLYYCCNGHGLGGQTPFSTMMERNPPTPFSHVPPLHMFPGRWATFLLCYIVFLLFPISRFRK